MAAGAAMEPPTSLGCAASGEGYVGKANLHLPRQVLQAGFGMPLKFLLRMCSNPAEAGIDMSRITACH